MVGQLELTGQAVRATGTDKHLQTSNTLVCSFRGAAAGLLRWPFHILGTARCCQLICIT